MPGTGWKEATDMPGTGKGHAIPGAERLGTGQGQARYTLAALAFPSPVPSLFFCPGMACPLPVPGMSLACPWPLSSLPLAFLS